MLLRAASRSSDRVAFVFCRFESNGGYVAGNGYFFSSKIW